MTRAMQHLSAFEWFVAVAIVVLAVWLIGAIANAVLKDLGFGTVLNGVLVLVGLLGGALLRSMTLGFQ